MITKRSLKKKMRRDGDPIVPKEVTKEGEESVSKMEWER